MPERIFPRARSGRLRGFLARLWGGLGVPQYELLGVIQLGEHVLSRIERLPGVQRESQLYSDWLASEFTFPLRALLWGSARDRRAHMLLNLVVVGGGFATSGIAVAAGSGAHHRGSTASWIVFGIGLLLAVVGGANQLFRPGYRAAERTTIAVELREEGWAFAMAMGVYSDADTAFGVFRERVSALQRQIAKIAVASEQASASGGRSSTARRRRSSGTSG